MTPLVSRNPTENEIQKFRLILSTYQDGSGQLAIEGNKTLPGWRDFERAVTTIFSGEAQENKYIFDVLMPDPEQPGIFVGISCKMRRTLSDTIRTGRVTLELSNSSGKFWRELLRNGINQQNYATQPAVAGSALIDLVESWHKEVRKENGGRVDLGKSYFLSLSWNIKGDYQLYKFPIDLPDPASLQWEFSGRRLIGKDALGVLFEWYGESGGQLKYYPLVINAQWKSSIFRLQPLPPGIDLEHGVLVKAKSYFPDLWEVTA